MRLDAERGGDETGLERLTGGEPPWPQRDEAPPVYPPLEESTDCEVVVVGAGVTGVLTAHLLVEAGLDVLLVEKQAVGCGSTSANTGLILYELDVPLHQLAERTGAADAVRVYQLGVEAIRRLGEVVGTLDDDCGFERRPSLYLASRQEDVQQLLREYEIRREHGLRVDFLEQADVEARYSFSAPAALLSHEAAQVDPFCLSHHLVTRAAHHGLRVHEETHIVAYENGPQRATLTTDRGVAIRAGRIVFATGYATERYLPRRLGENNSTYAIITEPMEDFSGWPDRALMWETKRPYTYLRTTPGGRILIGGMDEPMMDPERRDALIPEKGRELLRRLRDLFPAIRPRIASAWAGTFLNTPDSLPYIDSHPDFPRSWFALGYGGNGTTFGMIAADMLRDICLGRENPDLRLFRFDRGDRGRS